MILTPQNRYLLNAYSVAKHSIYMGRREHTAQSVEATMFRHERVSETVQRGMSHCDPIIDERGLRIFQDSPETFLRPNASVSTVFNVPSALSFFALHLSRLGAPAIPNALPSLDSRASPSAPTVPSLPRQHLAILSLSTSVTLDIVLTSISHLGRCDR